jgi:hypothetical protein
MGISDLCARNVYGGKSRMPKNIFKYEIDPEKLKNLNSFVLQKGYKAKLEEISRINFFFTQSPVIDEIVIPDNLSSKNSVMEPLKGIDKIELNPEKGCEFAKHVLFGGYDESKLKFESLEGTINITSHSLVEISNGDYFPVSYITINFYSRSNALIEKSSHIKYSDNPENDSASDYAVERNYFIKKFALDHSILFIDGPLIGGNVSSYALDLVDFLHSQNIIPIFIVKNSRSNLIIDNIPTLRGKFNSDLHWAYRYLSSGERTSFFIYTDMVNQRNTKILCYIKPFPSVSPQRVEFHPETLGLYGDYIDDIFNLIYYTILVNGDRSNPQARPIIVAEMYARDVLAAINARSMLLNTSLIPTINQERFGV